MKRTLILLMLAPVFLAATAHKFYVSTTHVEYVPEKQSVQLITKLFIDDIEDVLQERYDKKLSLATKKERPQDETYLKEYVQKKLVVYLDGKEVALTYIGREYDIDMVKVYLEAKPVSPFKTIEIDNQLLFDLTDEQQNITHVKYGDQRKSIVSNVDNPKGMLNFN